MGRRETQPRAGSYTDVGVYMVKRILAILLILSGQALAQGWVAEPGQGVGPVKLGMTIPEVASHLTPTEYIGTKKNPRFIRYGDFQAEYSVKKLVMISLHGNSFGTKSGAATFELKGGVQIGTPFTHVQTVFGRNYIQQELKTAKGAPRETYYAYRFLGIGFRTRADRVAHIDIFEPAR